MSLKHKPTCVCFSQAVRLDQTACDVGLSQAVCLEETACDVCLSQAVFDRPSEMLFYITSGASQAVPESACVETNRTACVELYCSSDAPLQITLVTSIWLLLLESCRVW
jgi:hypothetical protein